MIQKRKAPLTRMGFQKFPAENEHKCSASWRHDYRKDLEEERGLERRGRSIEEEKKGRANG